MGKIIAICGKICSGKSYYANILKDKMNAVILSCDEITSCLFDNNLGKKHDEMSKRIWKYLLKKSTDIVKTETNVILDWGFWSKEDRKFVTNYFKENEINIEWHYIDIDDKIWQKRIDKRNKEILKSNQIEYYFVDDGLKNKCILKFEKPNKDEIDIWVK